MAACPFAKINNKLPRKQKINKDQGSTKRSDLMHSAAEPQMFQLEEFCHSVSLLILVACIKLIVKAFHQDAPQKEKGKEKW